MVMPPTVLQIPPTVASQAVTQMAPSPRAQRSLASLVLRAVMLHTAPPTTLALRRQATRAAA